MSGAPIGIDFCDCGPGFVKTENFFYLVLRKRFNVQIADHPQFLIYTNPLEHMHRVHNCARIYFGVESYLPDWTECDYALTCHHLSDPRHLRLPYYVLAGDPRASLPGLEDPARALAQKTRFCSFIVSSHDPRKNRLRGEFFERLSRRKRVDSGGRLLNNIGGPIAGGPAGKLEFLRHYKFNIAFENESLAGYTTEKLIEAMRARCLPIYWGNPRVAEEFNPGSFLNYSDFASADALIDRILELDQDDAQYLKILSQPVFHHNNQPNEFYSPDRLLDFFGKIFETPIRPVSARRRFFRLGRWIIVKQNKPHGPG